MTISNYERGGGIVIQCCRIEAKMPFFSVSNDLSNYYIFYIKIRNWENKSSYLTLPILLKLRQYWKRVILHKLTASYKKWPDYDDDVYGLFC